MGVGGAVAAPGEGESGFAADIGVSVSQHGDQCVGGFVGAHEAQGLGGSGPLGRSIGLEGVDLLGNLPIERIIGIGARTE